jgi:predicted metal-dependent enzyme (double-stranded beta helix superfamily)
MQPRPGGAVGLAAPLSGFHMKLIARAIASRLDEWHDLVHMDATMRWHARLHGTADHDVWLESWRPGQGASWHDHGGSASVMVVAQGELEERIPLLGGFMTQVRRIPEGTARPLRRRQVHELANVSCTPALSVHVYSPPLETTRRYEIGARGLRRSAGNPATAGH